VLEGFAMPSSSGLIVVMTVGRAVKSCGLESREDKRSPPSFVLASVVFVFSEASEAALSTGGVTDEIARKSDAKSSPFPATPVFTELSFCTELLS